MHFPTFLVLFLVFPFVNKNSKQHAKSWSWSTYQLGFRKQRFFVMGTCGKMFELDFSFQSWRFFYTQAIWPVFWGQSYKTFYTLGQVYKRTLKHVNNVMQQTFVRHNVRTLHPNIFIGPHFSFSLNRQFRTFFYTTLKCKKFYRIDPFSVLVL